MTTTGMPLSRRAALMSIAAVGLTGCASRAGQGGRHLGALFAGNVADHGFMQSGFEGYQRALADFPFTGRYIDQIAPKPELLAEALTRLAQGESGLVVAHGGQNNGAAMEVAQRFPEVQFVVTQGNVKGANLSSYEVLQEQSAWLAGALAALTTRTGVVGHMSGIRVVPGLKGRAAFVDGVKAVNPQIRVLTNFSGNQHDNALSKRVAAAQIKAGADVIFTMLNAGRQGAIDACREAGVRQIGNVVDWTRRDPDVFIASAIADVSQAVYQAASDYAKGSWKHGVVKQIGLENESAVRLALGQGVPESVAAKVRQLAAEIVSGQRHVAIEYTGPEFSL